jgi:hypothetical protein
MPALRFESAFETIYATDLVYAPNCWKLCGDAHCCNFTRYKSQMSILGKNHFQELPLLPGEYEFLSTRGWIGRYADVERRVTEFPLARGTMRLEFLVGRSQSCACDHAARTTTCRLYPLLPVFDLLGRVTGIDAHFGIFEEIESIEQTPRACKIEQIPVPELGKFLAICNAIAQNPTHVFYVMAYQFAKAHAAEQLRLAKKTARADVTALRIFEGLFALQRLLDPARIRARLDELADQFVQQYGERFTVE